MSKFFFSEVDKIGNSYGLYIYDLQKYGLNRELIDELIYKKEFSIQMLIKCTVKDLKELGINDNDSEKIYNAIVQYMSDVSLKKYSEYKKFFEKLFEKFNEELIKIKYLLDEEPQQLCSEFVEYINKNEKYTVIVDDEIYIKKIMIKEAIDVFISHMIYKSNIPSIFTICEYGISISIADRLHQAGLTIFDILENLTIVNEFLGESKSNDVINAVKQIEDYNIESLYLLCEYGVSKNIIEQMQKENVTIYDLKINDIETLWNKYNMGKHASRVVHNALKKYIGISTFNKQNRIFEQQNEKIEQYKDNSIPVKHKNLDEAIEKYMNKDTYLTVIKGIFEGKSQADISLELDCSRERVRQVFNKAYSKLPDILDEDLKYKEIFCKYNWEMDIFCEVFETKKNVYYYLEYKYEKGQEELEKILGTDYLNKEQEEIIKKYCNLVLYNDMLIKEEKISLLIAILRSEGIQYVITDLVDKYNEVIQEHVFSKLEPIDTVKNIESILSRRNNIVASSKRRYRYYNYELLTENDIEELTNLLDVDDGAYYVDYFYRDNLEMMNRLNILDESELYNILKKYIKKDNITFPVLPIILIGYESKEEFFLEKMNNLSPINYEDFVNILNKDYGYKIESTKSYILKEFGHYITNGVLNTGEKEFSEDEIAILQQALTEKVYSIKELKIILKELLKKDCSEYIRSINFGKLGYRIREQYILRNDVISIDEIIAEQVLKDDIFDISTNNVKNLGKSFQWIFYELLYSNKIVRFANNLYYTNKWLNKNGITIEIINNFKQLIYSAFEEDEIFTLFNIKQKGLIDEYEILKINDIFLESIVKTIKGVKNLSIENNIVFLKSNIQYFNKADFIERIILDSNISKVKDIKDLLLEKYNINIELSQIKELIDLKKYEMEDVQKDEKILENESIENASDDYNIVMCLKYLEKVYGIGIQRKFSDDRNSEFLKRFDNALNTLTQKEKTITILKNGLKDGKIRTAEEVAEEIGIVSTNSVGGIEKRTIDKLKDTERTKILRTYFNFESTNIDNDTADFILDLL